MEFVKLKRHDIIKINKGMCVWAKIPQKFVFSNCILEPKCNSTYEHSFDVGKIYTFPCATTFDLKTVKSELKDNINSVLSEYGADPTNHKEKIDEFIKSLNLSTKKDTFDTSIFEGEYKIYHTDLCDGFNWIFCEKLDGSGLELKFDYQKDPDKIKFELLSTKK